MSTSQNTMTPSTASATDTMPESQAITAAKDDWIHANRLDRVHTRVGREFMRRLKDHHAGTEGILNELNRSISSRLENKITQGQSLLTDACESYYQATGEHPDGTTWDQPEPEQILTQDEVEDLLMVFQEAGERLMTDKPDLDRTIVKSAYVAYKSVILKDGFKA
jgi:hypothetical protein